MALAYQKENEPEYETAFQTLLNMGNPVDRDVPVGSADFNGMPSDPREFNRKVENWGDQMDVLFLQYKHRHTHILMTNQKKSKNMSHEWRHLKFEPTEPRPQPYGVDADIATYWETVHKVYGQGTNAGIHMARGLLEKGMDAYELMFNMQVKMVFDTMMLFQQHQTYKRVLGTPNQLMTYYLESPHKLDDLTVEQFFTEFGMFDHVNVFRRNNGWAEFQHQSTEFLTHFYDDIGGDMGRGNFMYLVDPEIRKILHLRKEENIYYVYNGKDFSSQKTNFVSIYQYMMEKYGGVAVCECGKFKIAGYNQKKYILEKYMEMPGYYYFPRVGGNNTNIGIINDYGKNETILKAADAQRKAETIYGANLVKLRNLVNDKVKFDKLFLGGNHGMWVIKRRIFKVTDSVLMKKKCVLQLTSRFFANGHIDPHTGELGITIYQRVCDILKHTKNVNVFEGTLIKACDHGQNTTFADVIGRRTNSNKGLFATLKGSNMFVIPVPVGHCDPKTSVVRPKYIDAHGHDDVNFFGNIVGLLKRGGSDTKDCYFPFHKEICKLIGFRQPRILNNFRFYQQKNIFKTSRFCFKAWQRNVGVVGRAIEPEEGWLQHTPRWYANDQPHFNVKMNEDHLKNVFEKMGAGQTNPNTPVNPDDL